MFNPPSATNKKVYNLYEQMINPSFVVNRSLSTWLVNPTTDQLTATLTADSATVTADSTTVTADQF